MDYLTQSPEVNSDLMYAGAGPDPMYAAVITWQNLANQVDNAAVTFADVLGMLLKEWTGPTAIQMFQAAAPFPLWLAGLAQQIRHTGAQLDCVYQAYCVAYKKTVAPQTIATNREELAKLTKANLLGLRDAEIQALEDEYSQYWAQDIEAMQIYEVTVNLALVGLPSWARPPGVAVEGEGAVPPGVKAVLRQLTKSR